MKINEISRETATFQPVSGPRMSSKALRASPIIRQWSRVTESSSERTIACHRMMRHWPNKA